MRFSLLASFLVLSLPLMAGGEEAAPSAATPTPPRPARLVGVILSSAQALLWDEELGEYVIHKVGEAALGGRLVELDADHIVVERGEARELIEISAPPQLRVAGRRQPKRMPAMIISAAPEVAEKAAPVAIAAPAAPSPPTVAPAAAPSEPLAASTSALTPVAPSAPVAVAPPPVAAGAITSAAPAVAATVAAPAPVTAAPPVAVPASVAVPAPVAVPVSAAPTSASTIATAPVASSVTASTTTTPPVAQLDSADRKPVTTTVLIPRPELDRELGDFAALSQDVQVATQPEGGFRLAQVRSGSFFERIGLRTNDVVLRIDGRPINGVEDASAAYAWLRVTNKFTVDVLRDGHPLTLRYVIAPAQPITASAR
jgi:hypothetical protein